MDTDTDLKQGLGFTLAVRTGLLWWLHLELDNHILTVAFVLLALWLYKMYHKELGRLFNG